MGKIASFQTSADNFPPKSRANQLKPALLGACVDLRLLLLGDLLELGHERGHLAALRLVGRLRLQLLADGGEQLAGALQLLVGAVVDERLQAHVHDARRQHVQLEQFADELHGADQASPYPRLLFGHQFLGLANAGRIGGLFAVLQLLLQRLQGRLHRVLVAHILLELVLQLLDEGALEELALGRRVHLLGAIGQEQAQLCIALGEAGLVDRFVEHQLDDVAQLVGGVDRQLLELVGQGGEIFGRQLVQNGANLTVQIVGGVFGRLLQMLWLPCILGLLQFDVSVQRNAY